MLVESVFSIVIAFFAVFGIYCTVKMFFVELGSSVPAAVVIEPSDDLEILKLKVKEADSMCLCGKCGVLVLIPESRENDKSIMNYVENKGFTYFYYKS